MMKPFNRNWILIPLGLFLVCFSCRSHRQAEDWMNTQARTHGKDEIMLPKYFDQERVQAHTRMGLNCLRKDSVLFYSLSDHFNNLGAMVFTRHIKGGGEGAWWPSKVGAMAPEVASANIAEQIINNAHENGQKIMAYHRHMEDNYLADLHPDWVCRMPDGKRITTRGERLCFNSPYADVFLERALELIDLGVDGFYFDETHQPKQGCWCCYCRKKFKEETGLDMPGYIDKDDLLYQELMDYKNLIIERTFVRYREAFKQRNPALVMIIGSNAWPSMADRHTNSRLWQMADIQKTEFELPVNATRREAHVFRFPDGMHPFNEQLKMAHGWVLARDASGGRPPHVWVNNLLNESAALFATSALVGHGCIANLDHAERQIPDAMFKKSYELGSRISPFLAGSKPLRWVALHYSELARDQYIGDNFGAWEHILYPHYGAFTALSSKRMPVGMITDSQLEDQELEGYKILFVTDPKKLSPKMQEAAASFIRKGGQVIYNDSTWKWHTREGQGAAIEKFMNEIDQTGATPPVKVRGGAEMMQVDQFFNPDESRLTIACINDFSWVWTGKTRDIELNNPERYQEILQRKPPAPCNGVEVVLQRIPGMAPQTVFDAVSGKALDYHILENEVLIRVPSFDYLALVVVEYRGDK